VIDAVAIREWCHARPGVTEERPFGPQTTVFKVEGKLFALCALESEPPLRLSLKCEPELAEALRRDHEAVAPGYHLNKRHWNTVTLDGSLPDAMVLDMLEDSYDLVVSAMPQKTRERLGWSTGSAD
jgi:predicted DNA-binding protein (MmcQ/YjbR family)